MSALIRERRRAVEGELDICMRVDACVSHLGESLFAYLLLKINGVIMVLMAWWAVFSHHDSCSL